MAAHESPRTTKLYDRPGDAITLDEVGRIRIEGRPYARAHIVSEYYEFIVEQTFETVHPLIVPAVKYVPQLSLHGTAVLSQTPMGPRLKKPHWLLLQASCYRAYPRASVGRGPYSPAVSWEDGLKAFQLNNVLRHRQWAASYAPHSS
jgi:hypothetical protein